MESQTKIVYGRMRARKPARIGRRWGSGIFLRELRAAFPTIFALAALMALFAGIGVMGDFLRERYHNGYFGLFGCKGARELWPLIALIVFLTLGVLCGAEEAENGTADFTRRLPVSRTRVYFAKTFGALAAVALYYLMACLLTNLVIFFGLRGFTRIDPWPELLSPAKDSVPIVFMGLVLFFCGQAAGFIVERVIIAAVVGGIPALFGIFLINNYHSALPAAAGLFLVLAAMAVAFIRFQTREGR